MRKLLLGTLVMLGCISGIANAHPGNTDDYGCHVCYTNCLEYGLYVGQNHCHEITLDSYRQYAPAGSCEEEKQQVEAHESELHEIEYTMIHLEEDIVEQYGGGITRSHLNALIADRSEELNIQYYDLYYAYETRFNLRNSCLEEAGFERYMELKEEALLLAQQSYELLSEPVVTSDEYCKQVLGEQGIDKGTGYCGCIEGYELNSDSTSCVVISMEETNDSEVWGQLMTIETRMDEAMKKYGKSLRIKHYTRALEGLKAHKEKMDSDDENYELIGLLIDYLTNMVAYLRGEL